MPVQTYVEAAGRRVNISKTWFEILKTAEKLGSDWLNSNSVHVDTLLNHYHKDLDGPWACEIVSKLGVSLADFGLLRADLFF
jgi:hypothetical protein